MLIDELQCVHTNTHVHSGYIGSRRLKILARDGLSPEHLCPRTEASLVLNHTNCQLRCECGIRGSEHLINLWAADPETQRWGLRLSWNGPTNVRLLLSHDKTMTLKLRVHSSCSPMTDWLSAAALTSNYYISDDNVLMKDVTQKVTPTS